MLFGTRVHSEVESYHSGREYDAELLTQYVAEFERGESNQCELVFSQEIRGHEFRGVIDRLTPHAIYDLKTAARSIALEKIEPSIGKQGYSFFEGYGLQATAYSYYVYHLTGKLLPFHFVVWRKDWSPGRRFKQVQLLPAIQRTKFDFALFENLVETVGEDILKEEQFKCTCNDGRHRIYERV